MAWPVSDALDIVTLPLTSWSHREVAELVPEAADLRIETRSEDDELRGAPEITAIVCGLLDHDLATVLARLTSRLGEPHQIIGGPPQLRWWASDTRQVILDATPLMLRVVPAEWSSAEEMQWVEVGEPDMAPYLWRTDVDMRRRPPDAVWVPGAMQPETLDDLRTEVEQICLSFARAATELPDEFVHSGNFIVTSPETRRWPISDKPSSGMPYSPRFDIVVTGDPWSIELMQNHGSEPLLRAATDRGSDVGLVVGRLAEELADWGYGPEELRFDGYATGQVPGKRGPKPISRKLAFTTLH